MLSGSSVSGSQMRTPWSWTSNPLGMMPTTWVWTPSMSTFFPTIERSPPKLLRHSSSERRTTGGALGSVSCSVNQRPVSGDTPSVGKRLAEVSADVTRAGLDSPPTLTALA